jgi:primosomal protein N' (replication factor Y) (superfamily II helicase)
MLSVLQQPPHKLKVCRDSYILLNWIAELSKNITKKTIGVLFPLPFDAIYTYIVPQEIDASVGDFVLAPFGRNEKIGVVWTLECGTHHKLKTLLKKFDYPPLPASQLRFIKWVADYVLAPLGNVLKLTLSTKEVFKDIKTPAHYKLSDQYDASKLTQQRKKVVHFFQNNGDQSLLKIEIKENTDVSDSVIKGLIDNKILVETKQLFQETIWPNFADKRPEFNDEQQAAVLEFNKLLNQNTYQVAVLEGVTGSGKTEVYFEAIVNALQKSQQVLVLLPEISLTSQWLERFQKRFGVAPTLWHSNLSAAQRRENWKDVLYGRARVIVGARSALFLPFKELGLTIIDEEHDGSYKQEEGVIYHARDMAIARSYLFDIPIILVSATPSFETLHKVKEGSYAHIKLSSRFGGAAMPLIKLVDMREDRVKGGWISRTLRFELKKNLEQGSQSLLYLNRRGYAPLMLCKACGFRLLCHQCSSWLVKHRNLEQVTCHHCGYQKHIPNKCEECEEENSFIPCGPGVERIAEEVTKLLPEARCLILSSDVVNTQSKLHASILKIQNHEIDIVIGTQIISKGYHFDNLTLVGVIDGDVGLSGGDLRSGEKTFQLLHQVSGRAGRKQKQGHAIIQTYQPLSPLMQALAQEQKEEFIELEYANRSEWGWPPFGRLAAVIVYGPSEREVDSFCCKIATAIPQIEGVTIYGPTSAPIYLLRGMYRKRFLLKAPANIAVQKVLKLWMRDIKKIGKVYFHIDVDPISFV